jgi:hypothetical protein
VSLTVGGTVAIQSRPKNGKHAETCSTLAQRGRKNNCERPLNE